MSEAAILPMTRQHLLAWRYFVIACRSQHKMDELGLRRTMPNRGDEFAYYGAYFCPVSWCIEERSDSHGECINCGETVVHVWVPVAGSNGSSRGPA